MNDKRRFNGEGDLIVAEPVPVKYELEVFGGWAVVRKINREERVTSDGVIIPGGGRSSKGEIVAVPKDCVYKPGDVVLYTNFTVPLEDLEEITGDKSVELVRLEEIYLRIKRCT